MIAMLLNSPGCFLQDTDVFLVYLSLTFHGATSHKHTSLLVPSTFFCHANRWLHTEPYENIKYFITSPEVRHLHEG